MRGVGEKSCEWGRKVVHVDISQSGIYGTLVTDVLPDSRFDETEGLVRTGIYTTECL